MLIFILFHKVFFKGKGLLKFNTLNQEFNFLLLRTHNNIFFFMRFIKTFLFYIFKKKRSDSNILKRKNKKKIGISALKIYFTSLVRNLNTIKNKSRRSFLKKVYKKIKFKIKRNKLNKQIYLSIIIRYFRIINTLSNNVDRGVSLKTLKNLNNLKFKVNKSSFKNIIVDNSSLVHTKSRVNINSGWFFFNKSSYSYVLPAKKLLLLDKRYGIKPSNYKNIRYNISFLKTILNKNNELENSKKNFKILNIFFYKYLVLFLESLTKKKILIKFSIFNKLSKYFFKKNFFYFFFLRFKFKLRRYGVNSHLFLNLILFFLITKNPDNFLTYICKCMSTNPLRNHRKFLSILKKLLKSIVDSKKTNFGLLGLYLDFRGKVGVAGNSKKRHFLINYGQTSSSFRFIKVNRSKGLVYTNTGVLGVTMELFY